MIVGKVLFGRASGETITIGTRAFVYDSATWMSVSAVGIRTRYVQGVCPTVTQDVVLYAAVDDDVRT